MSESKNSHIVVLGAGFGGLTFCKHFRHPSARVTIVDRTNHHLFQPLLYQVATAGLSAPEIAQPVRSILSKRKDITVLLDNVSDINLAERRVHLEKNTLYYDYLVLALGGCTSYFGHSEWEQFAPGLKSLDDALRIRSQVLLAFEKAENTNDAAEREKLMTLVVVGGGPTGVELAGAFAELARTVLKRDFRRIDPTHARIILVEGSQFVLSNLPQDLAESATRQLKNLGVQVRTSTRVKDIRRGEVELDNGEIIRSENIIWAAGVSATALTQKLDVELDRAGRVKVKPDLSLPGHPEVFAVGDMALVLQKDGKPVPGVSPAAMQMARHVAKVIEAEIALTRPEANLSPAQSGGEGRERGRSEVQEFDAWKYLSPSNGERANRPAFVYWDKGTMATIGRSAGVAWFGKVKISGWLAWMSWLFVHLIFLIGFRNKLAVILQWAYSYFAYKRSARIITGLPTPLPERK